MAGNHRQVTFGDRSEIKAHQPVEPLPAKKPSMTREELESRSTQWWESVSDERMLGRIEGQAMEMEMMLFQLTELGMTADRLIALLERNLAQHDLLIEAAKKILKEKEAAG